MSVQKSWAELQKMHRACRIVVDTLDALEAAAVPGVTTRELDRIARDHIEKAGAKPAFLGYRGYPATLCVSVNEEVVHGIPGERQAEGGRHRRPRPGLHRGRLLRRRGAHGGGGPGERRGAAADAVTRESLMAGIEQCRLGRRVGDIGHAVQTHAEAQGYSVVREFVGHGIGTKLHEEPQVPNYGPAGPPRAAGAGHVPGHRADGERGRPRGRGAGGRLDGGDEGQEPLRPLRALGGGDPARPVDPVGAVPLRRRAGGRTHA